MTGGVAQDKLGFMGRVLFLCAALGSLLSCASKRPEGRTNGEILFKEATRLIEDERYIRASEKLNLIRSRYPYSIYAVRAELLLADIAFSQENYIEATNAYLLFKDFHPRDKKMDYIVFRIAESFFFQAPSTFDRDISPALEALVHYRDVVEKYPKTKYAKMAKKKIIKIQSMRDAKERYIADFYFKTKEYFAARYRYLEILKMVNNKGLRFHSMKRIIESSYYLKEYKKCISYITQYQDHLEKKFPDWLSDFKEDCQATKA